MRQRLLGDVYEGWVVVGAAAVLYLIIGASVTYGLGPIFNELVHEFGWSVAATSLAFSLRTEVGGVAAPMVGAILDRVGAQRVIVGGVVVAASGALLMSMVQTLWQFYAAMVVMSFGVSGAGSQVGLAATATWFERRRARAMSIMTLGGGVGGLVAIAMAALVEEFGWRSALRILTAAMLAGGLGISTLTRSRPDGHPQPVDGIVRRETSGDPSGAPARWGIPMARAARSRSFVLLTLGMIAMSFATTAVVVHQVPYLEREVGITKAAAGSTVLLFTLISIVGRIGLGFIADRCAKRVVMAAATGIVAIGLAMLANAESFLVAITGIAIVAPGYGAMMPVRPALFADYFGTKHFGAVNGLATMLALTGGAAGPWAVGRVVDATGGYVEGWYLSAAVALAGIPLFLFAMPPSSLYREFRDAEAPRLA
ncbi:MAG: MFS transporter [Dehalococcoidia bacterium]|nr:MAG: MFS transporter [Dehalococcoidia bacterium]